MREARHAVRRPVSLAKGRSHEARPALMPGCDQPHPGMRIECIDQREEALSRHHERSE